jgi:hypothetical protein
MAFWGGRKIFVECLKEVCQFGNHMHCRQTLHYKDRSVRHAMDPNEVGCLLSPH